MREKQISHLNIRVTFKDMNFMFSLILFGILSTHNTAAVSKKKHTKKDG